MRACPATLLLSRGKSWHPCPRFVAAVDLSGEETSGLPGNIQILSGVPEEALPTFTAGRGYDAVVMGALTHRQGLSVLVGTLTSKLVESLDCDFVLVKPDNYRTGVELIETAVEASDDELEYEALPQPPALPDFVSPWQLSGR